MKKINKTEFKYKSGDYFEVEKICSKKIENGIAYYQVKWLGWDFSSNTWEPVDHLNNVKHLIKDFEKNNNNSKNS
jgi:hypothetical protein